MNNASRPIFIVSSPRSGSTLLRLILDMHPNIAIPSPCWLYELIYPYLYSYGNLASPENFTALCEDILATPTVKRWEIGLSADELAGRCAEPTFRCVYEELHLAWARRAGKTRWGEKSPRDSFWMREIATDFPEVQFIHIVRDGRDVAIDIADTLRQRPYSPFNCARLWAHFVGSILASRDRFGPDQYHEIKYEAFCADPEPELKELCAYLGEEFVPAMLSHHTGPATRTWAADERHAKTARPITTQYCEQWRRRLLAGDVAALEHELEPLLSRFGYPITGPVAIDEAERNQLIGGDIVTNPDYYEYKAWHRQRRKERLEKGVYCPSDRTSMLWSTV